MFNDDQIQKLATEYESVFSKYDELMIKYISHSFKSKRGEEFAHHGFLRRLSMLKHCIKTVVTALPPQNSDLPLKDNLNDATMALHAFVINIFGCVDNLSWVLVYELELENDAGNQLRHFDVGLQKKNKLLRKAISIEFCYYLEGIDKWFEYLNSYRHSLAHRIPLYIPPFMISKKDELELQKDEVSKRRDYESWDQLDTEQEQLGFFQPIMKHSFSEKADPVSFHPQILVDYKTVVEIADRVLKEI